MLNIQLRFYEELNDFLPLAMRKAIFSHKVVSKTAVKDVIESLGVPHTEVDLILVNGESVDFSYKVQDKDYISIFPVFEALDIRNLTHLRPQPLRRTRFILDVHLGKLAKYLRLLGFDVVYENNFIDETIILRSIKERRIVLTRDVGLLKNKKITHGHWMHHTNPNKQVDEVLEYFDLYNQCHPFTRCIRCNGVLKAVAKQRVIAQVPPLVRDSCNSFKQCKKCGKLYWRGTHYSKLKKWIKQIMFHCTRSQT